MFSHFPVDDFIIKFVDIVPNENAIADEIQEIWQYCFDAEFILDSPIINAVNARTRFRNLNLRIDKLMVVSDAGSLCIQLVCGDF